MRKNVFVSILVGLFFLAFISLGPIRLASATQQNETAMYNAALKLGEQGNYTQAVKTMNELLAIVPDNDLYLAYASHYERLAGDPENGLKHALKAIELNNNVPWYYASVAFNAYDNADIEITREYCQKVIDLQADKVGQDNYDQATRILSSIAKRIYTVTWTLDPSKGMKKDKMYFIPLPSQKLPYQDTNYEITGCNTKKIVTDGENSVLYFIPTNNKLLKLKSRVTITPYSYKKQLNLYKESSDISKEAEIYLKPSDRINPNNPKIKKLAVSLKKETKLMTIKNILSWMKTNIKYKIEDFKNAEDLLNRGYGECGGWSALFTALCRADGIAAREVWGVIEDPTPDHQFAPPGHLKGHAWAEFYLYGIGWIPVEPQSPGSVGFLPGTYIRLWHYDLNSHLSWDKNLRPSLNMFFMGGDIPEYTMEN